MMKRKCVAIVLAGGQGKRMGSKVQKQYLELDGKPVLYYSLNAFQQSDIIDEIVLVVGEGQENYCQQKIVNKFNLNKVKYIVCGGAERYHSVYNGLLNADAESYVFIHDGARPFITEDILVRLYNEVSQSGACVAAMPVKDTIKISDDAGFAKETPERSLVWAVQTPQVFTAALIREAYDKLLEKTNISVTDDAMVLEQTMGKTVKLVQGSYENIKITTPEDMQVAEVFLRNLK